MLAAILLSMAFATSGDDAASAPWRGPGRFCGYATMIDLAAGETLIPGNGAVEVAAYRWSGPFGSVDVSENNWAVAPRRAGRELESVGARHVYRKHDAGQWRYTLWDGQHLVVRLGGTAFDGTSRDLVLVKRVMLADRAAARATGCNYRLYYAA